MNSRQTNLKLLYKEYLAYKDILDFLNTGALNGTHPYNNVNRSSKDTKTSLCGLIASDAYKRRP